MTSIQKSNAMFSKARRGDNEVTTKEARQIARALRKSGVSAGESKVVASQLQRYADTFTAGGRKVLTSLTSNAQGATSTFTPAPGSNNGGGTVQEKAVKAARGLKEPELPGPNASPQEMLAYEQASKEFDRMFEMLSGAIKNREETLMAINRNT